MTLALMMGAEEQGKSSHHCSSPPRQGISGSLSKISVLALGLSLACVNAELHPPHPIENCSALCTGGPEPLNSTTPNVLIVSDSIGSAGTGYLTNLQAMLGPGNNASFSGAVGNAAVQNSGTWTVHKNYCGTSIGLAACARPWLFGNSSTPSPSSPKWDVIHFNWGLHDIAPKMYYPIPPELYVANMEAVYQDLKMALAPGGTLIWTTTTPVPPSYKNRNNSDVVAINALMAELFGPSGKHPEVKVHDLYSQIVERCNRDPASRGYPETSDCDLIQSRGVHMSDMGKQYTAILTGAAIVPYL